MPNTTLSQLLTQPANRTTHQLGILNACFMTYKTNFWLLLAVGMACLSPLLVFKGVELGGDDVLYARLAADMANGEPSFFINTHTTRLGFLVPLSALYLVFGIHDLTTVAFPLVSSLLAVGIVAFATQRLYGNTAAMWAALFCGLNPMLYRYSSIGMADIPAGVFYGLFVVGWVLVIGNRVKHHQLWAFISGFACVWAMTTRISIAPMIILTLGVFLFFSWRQTSLWKFPLFFFFAGGCVVGIPYLLFLWWHTGNPLYFLQAATGGYNTSESPWIIPYEGWRFWVRMSGLSILRASIEGFLFAAFPIIIALALLWRRVDSQNTQYINGHLIVAVISPLLILSHFSTNFTDWYPLHLDLRFGSPIIMPLSMLLGEACMRLPSLRLPRAVCVAMVFVVFGAAALGALAWSQHNLWSMKGAGASILVGLGVLGTSRGPKHLLPIILLVLLIGNWGHYFSHEYSEARARIAGLRLEANAIPQNASLPILTDQLTAQYLPYLYGFTSPPHIATWGTTSSGWTKQKNAPWPGSYYIVWYPRQAEITAGRSNGKMPGWVLQEVSKGTLVHAFADHPQFSPPAFDRKGKPSEDFQMWPKAGIYQTMGDPKQLAATNM